MIDREKVIDELKEGIDFAYHRCHCGLAVTMEKALALLESLKEQEPLKPFRGNSGWSCSACGNLFNYPQEYCDVCGRQVNWNDCQRESNYWS